MSQEYDLYLQRHKANVKRGYDWLRTNMPWLFEGQPDSAWQTEFEHDASKSNPDEYEAYDAYFYGGNRSYAVVQAFQYAWLLHIHRNSPGTMIIRPTSSSIPKPGRPWKIFSGIFVADLDSTFWLTMASKAKSGVSATGRLIRLIKARSLVQ